MCRMLNLLMFSALFSYALGQHMTNIDMLRSKYFKLERALWTIIRGGADRNFVLENIHNTHLTFFDEEFNEKGVYFTLFDPDQKVLHRTITHINLTVAIVYDMYLHDNAESYTKEQTIGFSRNVANIIQDMAKINNITSNKDYFHYIATVSLFQTNVCIVF